MSPRREKVDNQRSSDLLTTLMHGLDENDRRETIASIQRRIVEDREAAFQARDEMAADNS